MRKYRLAAFAAAIALAGSLNAQQPNTGTVAPTTGSAPAMPPASTPAVQTVPGALAMVDTEQLGPIENAGTLRIRSGSGTVVTMQAGITRVAVGDDKLLAVHVLEPREVLLQGLTAGRSTLFVWLTDHRRLRYDVIVVPKIDVLRSSLRDLDPGIEAELSADGAAIVLRGDVPTERIAREAERVTTTILGADQSSGVRVINLLRFPAASTEAEQALTSALESVDPRIHARRIRVGGRGDQGSATDALVLEGRVRNLSSLVRAVTLADLQMGGDGSTIEPVAQSEMNSDRNQNFSGVGGGGISRLGTGQIPQGTLATFVARGLVLRSGSGRVLSFLEVDELPQIMVSIRALQIDRGKARRLGVDYRLDARHVSIGSYNNPNAIPLHNPTPGPDVRPGIVGGAGNLLAAFVDQTVAISAAIDLLEQKTIARSVAEPNITTLSGEQASVLVGGEVPIPTTTVGQVTAVQGFLFQSFGVRLDIRPTLNPNGVIALELAPSIIKPSADLAVGGVPGFEVQTVHTNAKVAPGQSLLIGGLLSFDDTVEHRGIPGLSSIPVIKHLFSWENKSSDAKELIFVITPRVLSESVAERPLDEVQWSTVEPLPFGHAPVLPTVRGTAAYPAPPAPLKPNGLPPDLPLEPTVVPQPDVIIQPAPMTPVVSSYPAPAVVVVPPTASANVQTTTVQAEQPAAAVTTTTTPAAAAVTTTTTTTVTTSAPTETRPAPQPPKTELPPPPTPNPVP